MAAADTVESQLRNTVRAARTRSLRCVKAIIAKKRASEAYVAVGQNQWYHFGVGAPPIEVYFGGDWDVH